MRKILVFYTSVGLGHKVIAENIAYHLKSAGFDVVLEDILAVEGGGVVSGGTWLHQFVNKRMPWLWSFLYTSRWFSRLTMGFRAFVASFHNERTKEVIDREKPDLVITTQTTASAAVAALKQQGLYKGLFVISFSDFHFHPYWYYREADYYLVTIEEQVSELEKFGVVADRIFVCGMSLLAPDVDDREALRGKFGFSSQEKVILIASGSLGTLFPIDFMKKLVEEIKAKKLHWSVVVVCGKSEELRKSLEKQFHEDFVKVYGFYKPMEGLYAIADVFFTKPGGLSTAQALQSSLPLVITHWLPGQEELNYRYLKQKGLIFDSVFDLEDADLDLLIDRLETEMLHGDFRRALSVNELIKSLADGGRSGGVAVVQAVKRMFHIVD